MTQLILFLILRIFRTQIIIFFSSKNLNSYKNNNIFDMNIMNYKKKYLEHK
jgi:hypothetical protein